MSEQDYTALEGVVTPSIQLDLGEKETVFLGMGKYMDADDELREIAAFIKENTTHNALVDESRIKFLYTTKTKKVGGKYVLGDVVLRSELDKQVDNEIIYDYIIYVYYQIWKELEIADKVIQLDKLLCGTNPSGDKKEQVDSREYSDNLWHYTPDNVLKSTQKVNMSISNILETEKEARKNKGETGEDDESGEVYREE